MSGMLKKLLVSIAAAGLAVSMNANASELRAVACSVSVDYSLNRVVRSTYHKDFVIALGVAFSDDFSTVTRFRFFDASTQLVNGDTVVSISYFNDVGVFDSVDFGTTLTLRNGRDAETTTGSNSFFTSRPASAEHRTNYTLSCSRARD